MVKQYRKFRDWTQADFAAWSGLSPATVSLYERHPHRVPVAMVRLLAILLVLGGKTPSSGSTDAERTALAEAEALVQAYARKV